MTGEEKQQETTTPSSSAATSPNASNTVVDDSNNNNKQEPEKIEKAIKFWTHPSLQNVSSEEKRAYLRERVMTDAQIHKAWETMVEQEPVLNTPSAGAAASTTTNSNHVTPAQQRFPESNSSGPYNASTPYAQQHPYTLSSYPSPYYPQQQSQQQPPYPSDYDNDDDGVVTVAKGISLLAVGGMLGVTAAAAVRWLNGGDFQLLPPPTTTRRRTTAEQDEQVVVVDEMDQEHRGSELLDDDDDDECYEGVEYGEDGEEVAYRYNGYVEEEDDGDDDHHGHNVENMKQLAEKMEQLLEAVSTNTETQERLMRKIANNSSTITNQSMDLLRNSQTPLKDTPSIGGGSGSCTTDMDASSLLSELSEIQKNMKYLGEVLGSRSDAETEEEVTAETLEKLEKIIDLVKASTPSPSQDDSPATATTATDLATPENSTSSPSTPAVVRSASATETGEIPPVSTKSLHECIRQIANGNDAATLKVGTQLLYLYLVNLSGKPDNPRYRKIYTSNQSFQKVESLVGGREMLQTVGFEPDEGKSVLEWVPSGSADEEAAALVLVKEASSALGVLKSGTPSASLSEQALSKLTPPPESNVEATPTLPKRPDATLNGESADPVPPPPPTSQDDIAPQTPAGTMLVSPPMTKKLPFPEGTPTNLSDLLERSSTASSCMEE